MTPTIPTDTATFGDYYRGKHALVTGATGVKGTWLCLALQAAGAIVTGIDLHLGAPTSNFVLSGLSDSIRVVQGDVNDLDLIGELLSANDCFFHLAALALVHDCKVRPLETYRVNTLGTATVLEAFRLSSRAKRGLFVTTDKVYRPKSKDQWVETDPLFSSGPYAVSKACAEQVIEDYRDCLLESGKYFGVARAGNVLVGGDDHSSSQTNGAGRIFVDCFESLIAGGSPEIFSPAYTRPYTYGLDIIAGYMTQVARMAENPINGEAFNFGPHEQGGIANAFLATKICEEWGGNTQWKGGVPRQEPFQTQALNWEKARNLLGWQPAYTLFEAIRDAAIWYKEWATIRKAPKTGAMHAIDHELLLRHASAARRLGIWWAVKESRHPSISEKAI